jgi:hypothetical protein
LDDRHAAAPTDHGDRGALTMQKIIAIYVHKGESVENAMDFTEDFDEKGI